MDGVPLAQATQTVLQAAASLVGVHLDNDTAFTPNDTEHVHGVHVVSWNFQYVAGPLLISLFVLVAGLLKLGFHYAEFLSSVVPESCLLISVGTIMGVILYFLDLDDYFQLEPRTFMLFLLPPIILEASYSIHDRVFAQNIGTILLFAVVGTILNFFVIGPCLYGLGLSGAMGHINLSMPEALLFASFIIAVDPVAVLAIFQEVGVNNVLYFIVFGESLLNDAVTIVLYNTMKSLSQMESIPPSQIAIAVASFFTVSLGGLAIGILIGILSALITKKTSHVRVVEPLAILVMAYLSYIVAELFHWSGIISMIGCGLVQAQYAMENISRKSYTTVHYFVKMLSAAFDAVIFMFLGLELVRNPHEWHTGFVLWSLLLCLLVRLIFTFGLSLIANRGGRQHNISLEEQFIMWYGGLRGAVCFALVDTLPNDFHLKHMFLTTTFVVIMFTVFIQGMTIKPLVTLCKIRRKEEESKTGIWEELNTRVLDHVMSGIECVSEHHGDNYFRSWFNRLNDNYLRRWLQVDPRSNDEKILDIYKEVQMRDYADHVTPFYPGTKIPPGLTGPVVDPEFPDESARFRPPGNDPSAILRHPSTGAELRRRTGASDTPSSRRQSTLDKILGRRGSHDLDVNSNADIKRLLRSTRPESLDQRYDPNITREDHSDLYKQLQERHARSQRLTAHRQRQSMMYSMSTDGRRSDNVDRPDSLQRPVSQHSRGLEPLLLRGSADALLNSDQGPGGSRGVALQPVGEQSGGARPRANSGDTTFTSMESVV